MDCPLCKKIADRSQLPDEDLVWEFPFSYAFLGPWQYYTGYCILVSRSHHRELTDIPPGERLAYFDEMCLLSQAIEKTFQPRKMNHESLGNQVQHPHWHLFPRREDDPEHLQAVWLALARADRDEAEKLRLQTAPISRSEITRRLRTALQARG